MSASRERKKRQEYFANGGVDTKAVKAAEIKAAQRKTTILYSVIGIAFVVITAALMVINSGMLQRNADAVTVDGTTFSAADAAFYYNESYMNVYNTVTSQYGSYGPTLIGLDGSKPLDEQKVYGSTAEDAQTWDEYFKEQAAETMRFVVAAKAAAAEEGYTMTAEDEVYVTERIDEMKEYAKLNGLSYKKYLTYAYGNLMTVKCFESNLKDYALSTSYAAAYTESLEFTDAEVKAVYDANTNAYDSVSYIRVQIDATPDYDADNKAIEYTEDEQKAGFQKSQTTGKALLEVYNNGGDLEKACKEYDFVEYYTNDSVQFSDTDYVTWAFEAGRKDGDVKLFEDETTGRCNLLVFRDRYLNTNKTVDVRHILVTADSVGKADATNEEIKAKAEEIFAKWDGTEDGFAALAREYSQDANASLGGIYEAVTEGYMVDTYNDWIFDSSRKSGDTGLVETSFGWHIMYFIGDNDPLWYVNAKDTLVTGAYNEWRLALLDEVGEATTHEKGMSYVG